MKTENMEYLRERLRVGYRVEVGCLFMLYDFNIYFLTVPRQRFRLSFYGIDIPGARDGYIDFDTLDELLLNIGLYVPSMDEVVNKLKRQNPIYPFEIKPNTTGGT